MTTKQIKRFENAVKKADEALVVDGEQAFDKAAKAMAVAEVNPAPKGKEKAPKAAKEPKAPKEPKVKKVAASAIEIDVTEFKQKHDKHPGTGKQDPSAIWRFLIGTETVEIATMFFREAKAKALAKAIEADVRKITVLA